MTAPHPPAKPTFTLLQVFRGWAALLVVLYHASNIAVHQFSSPFLNNYFRMGNAGVDFFFVLSGFLITYLHRGDIGHPQQLKPYLKKRLIRIYPAYWLVTLLILPFYFVVPHYGRGDETQLPVVVKSLLLIPMEHAPILTAGWTLSYELAFYAVFACLIAFSNRIVRFVVLACAGCCVVGTCLAYLLRFSPQSVGLRFLLMPRNAEFLFGCLAALLLAKIQQTRTTLMVCTACLAASLLAFALAELVLPRGDFFTKHVVIYGLLSLVIIVTSAALERAGALRVSWRRHFLYRFALYKGDASYSLYLVHGPCLSLFFKVADARGLIAQRGITPVIVAVFLLTVTVGCGFHALIERPLLVWMRRVWVRENRFA